MKWSLFLALAACGFAETTVLKNFTLIDGNGGTPVAQAAMVIVDGRIRYAGPASGMKVPAGAAVEDLGGKFVIPGIINLHGHLGNTIGVVQDPKHFTRENVEKQLKTYASYGVTSMISMGTDKDLIFEMRAAQRAGRPTMTRIFTAGRGFTGKGGYPTTAQGMTGVPYEVTSVAQVESAVKELAAKKVDVVKIWVDDHLGREVKIPMDLSKAIIENAHKNKIKVMAHVFYEGDALALVEAGLDGLAHSVRDKPVSDALINAMKKRGAWQAAATFTREISTFAYDKPHPSLDDKFFTRSISPEVVTLLRSPGYRDKDAAKFPAFLATAQKNLKKLVDSGVLYGFGTDTGPPYRFPGYFEHWEMQLMKDAGLTPMQILTSATKSAAAFLGATKDLGTLEAGKWADLVVLEKSPLADIKNTRTIERVLIAGQRAN